MDEPQPIVGGRCYGYSVDFDGTVSNDYELITRYREMVLQPECDSAVDDIVNETICGNFDDVPVEVELSNLKQSEKIKKLIRDEFNVKFFVCLTLIIVLMKFFVDGMSMGDCFIIR